MSTPHPDPTTRTYSAIDRAPHSLHECQSAEEARLCLETTARLTVEEIAGHIVSPGSAKAVFLVGSIPLGMATSDSDIDLLVLLDNRSALLNLAVGSRNTTQRLCFTNESDPLRAGEFLSSVNGVLIDMTVILTPGIDAVYARLREKGPELSEREIMTVSRLSTGWMLWETPGYIEQRRVRLKDSALDVYCSTRNFVNALQFLQKGRMALDLEDLPLALHLGHCSVESAYLAYLASEGISYLGAKWVAQVSGARGAAERLGRHPVLSRGLPLLFPSYTTKAEDALKYLESAANLISALRSLIESRTMFRIAFQTCPQIHAL